MEEKPETTNEGGLWPILFACIGVLLLVLSGIFAMFGNMPKSYQCVVGAFFNFAGAFMLHRKRNPPATRD